MTGSTLRIDKLLWYLRLAPSRSQAQQLVASGMIRVDGVRVQRASHGVAAGSVITLPNHNGTRLIAVDSIPTRRGPAPEAQACYRVMTAAAKSDDPPATA
ncbi:MAG: S4 domain-containing protein [Sphingopyxis sp.]|jgi:ribosome-associated heat shock protein Hsp15|nr:S4 domain-containing protein [Sphingopyxis sp.]